MVARTGDRERIDLALRSAEAEVADLPALVVDWRTMGHAARAVTELEWDDLMDRLEDVVEVAAAGRLSDAQRAAYEQVLRRLREHLPLTRQLDLPVPEKVLEAIRVAA